jgi:hypothetical protein
MTQDNPNGSNGDGGGKPPTDHHNVALAIEALRGNYKTAQCERANHDRKVLFWSRLTGIFVIGYTLLTVGVVCASIYSAWQAGKSADAASESLRITRENFIADQRPIIWLTDVGKPHWTPLAGGRITWNWYYTNYGKSPANNVRIDSKMVLENAALPSFEPIEKWHFSQPIPPTRTGDYITTPSDIAVNNADFDRLMKIDKGISIIGAFDYTDAGGNHYQTAFCLWHLATDAIMYGTPPSENCHNEIK